MKKKVFFILAFVAYLGILLYLDWLKGTTYAVHLHGQWIRIKTVTMILGGLALVYGFLGRKSGHLFAVLYLLLWLGYGGIQFMVGYFPVGSTWRFRWEEVRDLYLAGTQLLSPLPIMVFWLAHLFFVRTNQGTTT
jgi:hypothetical protein